MREEEDWGKRKMGGRGRWGRWRGRGRREEEDGGEKEEGRWRRLGRRRRRRGIRTKGKRSFKHTIFHFLDFIVEVVY